MTRQNSRGIAHPQLASAALALMILAGQSSAVPRAGGTDAAASAGEIVRVQDRGEVNARLPRPRPATEVPAEDALIAGPAVDAAPIGAPPVASAVAAPPPPPVEALPEAVVEEDLAATAAVRMPRARPDISVAEMARLMAHSSYGFTPDFTLKAAIDALGSQRYAEARVLAAKHPDPVVPRLLEWLIAKQPDSGLTPLELIAILERHVGWPDEDKVRVQIERAFHAGGQPPESVLAFYSLAAPRTIGGKLSLAGALQSAGRGGEAAQIIRAVWREDSLAPNQAAAVLARFGLNLTRDDHLYRFRRLVLESRTKDAVAQAQLIGPGHDKLARAVTAVIDRNGNGAKLLRENAAKFSTDPLYLFARVRLLLRSGDPVEAAQLIVDEAPDAILPGSGDLWWDTRRDLSRMLLDEGAADLAYKVVAQSNPSGDGEQVEAAFHAGWYALRFLDDPARAEPHFRKLAEIATLPRTRARASYWLGRTLEAAGKADEARSAFTEAGRFGGSFYGQLAREKLGLPTTGVERPPAPSALDRLRFAEREGVRAIRLLAAAGHANHAFPFFRAVAQAVETPGEVALLTALARRIEQPRAGNVAAALAEQRGLAVTSLPSPFLGVPSDLPMPSNVDRALVYSIVRQESAFNYQATSHVGARGLMQLMPATARATARSAQLPFSEQRLTSDPLYNATLGAHHLGELLDRLDQSYILTFVGYNAGPGRSTQWVKAYGDPRGGSVDPVDWIERIPFDETRNYVQKVMENLQVYRSRSGYPLSLSEDLIRGGSQG